MREQTFSQVAVLLLLLHLAESETRHAISMRAYWRMYLACGLSFIGFFGLLFMAAHYLTGGLGTHDNTFIYQVIGGSFLGGGLISVGLIVWRRKRHKKQSQEKPPAQEKQQLAQRTRERVVDYRHPLD